nr:MAG TPA: hypothetical protein [Caudoviricetes sp.]
MLLFVIDRLDLSVKNQINNYKFKTSKIRLFTIFSRLFWLKIKSIKSSFIFNTRLKTLVLICSILSHSYIDLLLFCYQ